MVTIAAWAFQPDDNVFGFKGKGGQNLWHARGLEELLSDTLRSVSVLTQKSMFLAASVFANGRFGPVPAVTQKLRAFKPRKGSEIYSYIYELLAAVGMRQKVDECSPIIGTLAREIRPFPRFSPGRPEWKLIRAEVQARMEPFSEREREIYRSC